MQNLQGCSLSSCPNFLFFPPFPNILFNPFSNLLHLFFFKGDRSSFTSYRTTNQFCFSLVFRFLFLNGQGNFAPHYTNPLMSMKWRKSLKFSTRWRPSLESISYLCSGECIRFELLTCAKIENCCSQNTILHSHNKILSRSYRSIVLLARIHLIFFFSSFKRKNTGPPPAPHLIFPVQKYGDH